MLWVYWVSQLLILDAASHCKVVGPHFHRKEEAEVFDPVAATDIELPNEGGSYTSLRDMLPMGSNGKSQAGAPVVNYLAPNSGKRRR